MILCDSDAAIELQFFAAQTMRKKVCYICLGATLILTTHLTLTLDYIGSGSITKRIHSESQRVPSQPDLQPQEE